MEQQQHQNGSIFESKTPPMTQKQQRDSRSTAKKNVIAIGKVKRRVTELKCAEIRWFYRRREGSKWIPFNGLLTNIAFNRKFPSNHSVFTQIKQSAAVVKSWGATMKCVLKLLKTCIQGFSIMTKIIDLTLDF